MHAGRCPRHVTPRGRGVPSPRGAAQPCCAPIAVQRKPPPAKAAIRDALDLLIVADLLDIAAAVLAVVFVRALTRMQRLKAAAPPLASTELPLKQLDAGRM
ncbi:hypothetical protein [Streptomyces chryseus]|uniref:hypothetical protein n=1 Tax=Streptomyces chryseus TaxID=68186 RepID=UPI00110FF6E0|nr:hypothetical protein [Streptomyces chryseus]GGX38467.1 hypothetical protein GCM10010353_62420 [Streptomyces chryseus]